MLNLIDFYFKKMQDAKLSYQKNHTKQNYDSFMVARDNYHTILNHMR